MVFPAAHKYISMSGGLPGGEAWSMGVRVPLDGFDGDQTAEQGICDDLAAALSSWWTGQNVIGAGASLVTVKYNAIGADGRYMHPYTVRTDLTTPVQGSISTTYPNQIALVATLETGFVRGLAHRGRLFVPRPALPLATDGRISQANAAGAASTLAGLINTINGVASVGRVMVASAVGAGASREVTAVSVGRVLDTMRSRRTSLEEARESAAVAAGS